MDKAPTSHARRSYSRSGSAGGEVGYIPDGIFPVLGQRTVLISPDHNKVFSRYLHYLLISPAIQHTIQVHSAGSTVHHLNMKDIRELELPELPSLAEQREIASILGALDDKIELNRRMAGTLEEIARALYRSWFVDFDSVKAKAEGLAPAFMDEATAALFPDRFGDDGLPEGGDAGVSVMLRSTPEPG
ncbi:restriction endonuclease subunit S [Gemmobacter lanyuensis]